MALISRLPSGGMSTSRSTKIHTGSTACVNNTENTVFEFTGCGKVNKVHLTNSASMGSDANAYFAIIIDGLELHRLTDTMAAGKYILYRNSSGDLVIAISSATITNPLPLDIEFKNDFKVVAYSTKNNPTVSYNVEISEN